jgi:hypothetical protein
MLSSKALLNSEIFAPNKIFSKKSTLEIQKSSIALIGQKAQIIQFLVI